MINMEDKMAKSVVVFLGIFLIGASADFVVLKSPDYVRFVKGASAIETSEIGPLVAASFGLPLDEDIKWPGLEGDNLFRRPKATAVISVSGVPDNVLKLLQAVASYKTIEVDNNVGSDYVINKIESFGWSKDPLTVDVYLDENRFNIRSRHSELFSGLPSSLTALRDDVLSAAADSWFSASELRSLNVSSDSELAFAGELYIMQQVVNALLENKAALKTNSPDFFHFSVDGLNELAIIYGVNSVQFMDALNLLQSTLAHVTDKLQLVYGNDVVVELVTFSLDSASKSRNKRAVSSFSAVSVKSLNLAPLYTDSYPAIFNICLWFMIAFGLAVLYISWAIWFMDPGLDSIIYRMTSTRMKRD